MFGPNLAVKSDNAFVHCKLSNERFTRKGGVVELFDRLQYIDRVGGVHWTSSAGPKYEERQENHTKMASEPVLYSK